MTETRKLAAILVADVVDYGRLAGVFRWLVSASEQNRRRR
jgi:hypothetical protein